MALTEFNFEILNNLRNQGFKYLISNKINNPGKEDLDLKTTFVVYPIISEPQLNDLKYGETYLDL